jgi:hypothetical protein
MMPPLFSLIEDELYQHETQCACLSSSLAGALLFIIMASTPAQLPFLEGSSRAVGSVGQVVGRTLYGAQVKALLTCGLNIVATIALLLADVALVVWVFTGRGYR